MLNKRVISSFGKVTPGELASLREQTARERLWYADIPSFADNQEIETSVQAGRLVHVTSTDNYKLIGRLSHRRTDVDQLPFTTPSGLLMIHILTDRWRRYADDAGIDRDIRLSLTSLVRTLSYQRALSGEDAVVRGLEAPPKLALPSRESTHPKIRGGAVDFDSAGYYTGYGRELTSVRMAGTEQHTAIRTELIQRLGETASPILADASVFNPDVPLALKAAADDMHQEGLVNRVIEFKGQSNECLHVAVHPDFLSLVA